VYTKQYNRTEAAAYAAEWAFKRNPQYLNFDNMGGDCTNFTSQCIYAGSGVMNPVKTFGWYYYSSYDRAPAWTGVQYLYNFLIGNKGIGPFAQETERSQVQPGDIVQLGTTEGSYYHSPFIVAVNGNEIFVAAHSDDAYMRPLSTYSYSSARFLKIEGVRVN